MFTLVATIKAIRWIFKKHPCMLDIHTTPSAPVSRIGFNGRHTIMRAFFSTYFATIIHDLMCTIKPISIFFTVLNIPLLPSFGVHIDYLNITLCLLDLFHGSNAVITVRFIIFANVGICAVLDLGINIDLCVLLFSEEMFQ